MKICPISQSIYQINISIPGTLFQANDPQQMKYDPYTYLYLFVLVTAGINNLCTRSFFFKFYTQLCLSIHICCIHTDQDLAFQPLVTILFWCIETSPKLSCFTTSLAFFFTAPLSLALFFTTPRSISQWHLSPLPIVTHCFFFCVLSQVWYFHGPTSVCRPVPAAVCKASIP